MSDESKEPEQHNDFSVYGSVNDNKRYLLCPHCGEECGCETMEEGCGHCPEPEEE